MIACATRFVSVVGIAAAITMIVSPDLALLAGLALLAAMVVAAFGAPLLYLVFSAFGALIDFLSE